MTNPAHIVEAKVITDVQEVYNLLAAQPLERNGLMNLPLEVSRKPMITVRGGVEGDPLARRVIFDEDAPLIDSLDITGYSIYKNRNAGGPYARVVAHRAQSHTLDVIKIQRDIYSDKTHKDRLFISKDCVPDSILIPEDATDEEAQVKCRGFLYNSETVWFQTK